MNKRYPDAGLAAALQIGAKVATGEMKWAEARDAHHDHQSGYHPRDLRRFVRRERQVCWRHWRPMPDGPRPSAFPMPEPTSARSRLSQACSSGWRRSDGYSAKVHTYLADGDRVAAFGVYSGTYRKTGKAMTAGFAHLYRLKEGWITSMAYVDSHLAAQAPLA